MRRRVCLETHDLVDDRRQLAELLELPAGGTTD